LLSPQEIILWRKGDKTRKPFQASLQQQYKQMQNPNVVLSNSDSSLKSGAPELKTGEESDASGQEVGRRDSLDAAGNEQTTPDKEFQSVINSSRRDDTEPDLSVSACPDQENHTPTEIVTPDEPKASKSKDEPEREPLMEAPSAAV
jgi:hypothetical protein